MAIKDHRMMLSRTFIAALLALAFSLFGTSAFAVTYTIDHRFRTDNSEFEINVPSHGDSLGNGWYTYLPDLCIECDKYYYGQYEETGIPAGIPNGHYDDGVNRGQVSELLIDVIKGNSQYPLGMEKKLGIDLEANTQYGLSVAVGNPRSVSGGYDLRDFGGYRIELLAGIDVIGSKDSVVDSITINEGEFAPASFSVFSQDLDAGLIGAALGIRLIHKNVGVNPGPRDPNDPNADPTPVITWAIAFDDVSLTVVSAVPVPAAVWLFGTALLGLLGFGKRRKTVQPV